MFDRAVILAFHQTSRHFYPGINNIRPGYFFDLMEVLEELGFCLRESDREGESNRPAVISFDDGYEDNCEVLFRLRDLGIRPIVFVPTDFIGRTNSWEYSHRLFPARHMSREKIREMAEAGVIFGSHGASHRALTGFSGERLHRELADSRKILEDITGNVADLLSYPFGRSNGQVAAIARELGYSMGMALDSSGHDNLCDDGFTRFRIPVYRIDTYFSLRAKLVENSALERRKNSIINELAGGTIITGRRLK